jgi:hypothetical protein
LATRTQIIAVLSNVTAIEIRGTYATNATYTSGIDNVVLEQRALSASPTIASVAPTSGEPGTVVTITGTNFDTTPTNNAVYFGSIAGTIASANATQLSVTIPIGAPHDLITVINKVTGTSKRSEKPFNPTFAGVVGLSPLRSSQDLIFYWIQPLAMISTDWQRPIWMEMDGMIFWSQRAH